MDKYKHLLGKNFVYGEQDCLTLLTEYFRTMHGIEVCNDYARFPGWEREGLNLFADNYYEEGFRLLEFPRADNWFTNLQDGDVLLMSVHSLADQQASGVANHCAVWVEPKMILHHMFGRRSEIRDFNLKNATTHILRHEQIPMKEKEVEQVDFFDILSPRKREMLENVRRASTEV